MSESNAVIFNQQPLRSAIFKEDNISLIRFNEIFDELGLERLPLENMLEQIMLYTNKGNDNYWYSPYSDAYTLLEKYVDLGGKFTDDDIDKIVQNNMISANHRYINVIELFKKSGVSDSQIEKFIVNKDIPDPVPVGNLDNFVDLFTNGIINKKSLDLMISKIDLEIIDLLEKGIKNKEYSSIIDASKERADLLIVMIINNRVENSEQIELMFQYLNAAPKIDDKLASKLFLKVLNHYDDNKNCSDRLALWLLDNNKINLKISIDSFRTKIINLININMSHELVKKVIDLGYKPKNNRYSFFEFKLNNNSKDSKEEISNNIKNNLEYIVNNQIKKKDIFDVDDFCNVNNKKYFNFLDQIKTYLGNTDLIDYVKEAGFLEDDLCFDRLIKTSDSIPDIWNKRINDKSHLSFYNYIENMTIDTVYNPNFPMEVWEDYFSDPEAFKSVLENSSNEVFQEWQKEWLKVKGEDYRKDNRKIIEIISYLNRNKKSINSSLDPLLDCITNFQLRHRGVPGYFMAASMISPGGHVLAKKIAEKGNPCLIKGDDGKYLINELLLKLNTYFFRLRVENFYIENYIELLKPQINHLPDDFLDDLSDVINKITTKFKYVDDKKILIYSLTLSLKEQFPDLKLKKDVVDILINNCGSRSDFDEIVNAVTGSELTTPQSNKLFTKLIENRSESALELYVKNGIKMPTANNMKKLMSKSIYADTLIKKFCLNNQTNNLKNEPKETEIEEDDMDIGL